MIGPQDDAVAAQPVGDHDRKLRVADRVAHTHRRGRPGRQLEPNLLSVAPALAQLPKAQLVDVVEDRLRGCGGDPVAPERAGHDVHLAADDPEQERVADRDRQLVSHRRRALGIAVEE